MAAVVDILCKMHSTQCAPEYANCAHFEKQILCWHSALCAQRTSWKSENPTLECLNSKFDFLNSCQSMKGEVLISSSCSILVAVFCHYSSILAGWHKRRSKSRFLLFPPTAGLRQVTYIKGEKLVLKVWALALILLCSSVFSGQHITDKRIGSNMRNHRGKK